MATLPSEYARFSAMAGQAQPQPQPAQPVETPSAEPTARPPIDYDHVRTQEGSRAGNNTPYVVGTPGEFPNSGVSIDTGQGTLDIGQHSTQELARSFSPETLQYLAPLIGQKGEKAHAAMVAMRESGRFRDLQDYEMNAARTYTDDWTHRAAAMHIDDYASKNPGALYYKDLPEEHASVLYANAHLYGPGNPLVKDLSEAMARQDYASIEVILTSMKSENHYGGDYASRAERDIELAGKNAQQLAEKGRRKQDKYVFIREMLARQEKATKKKSVQESIQKAPSEPSYWTKNISPLGESATTTGWPGAIQAGIEGKGISGIIAAGVGVNRAISMADTLAGVTAGVIDSFKDQEAGASPDALAAQPELWSTKTAKRTREYNAVRRAAAEGIETSGKTAAELDREVSEILLATGRSDEARTNRVKENIENWVGARNAVFVNPNALVDRVSIMLGGPDVYGTEGEHIIEFGKEPGEGFDHPDQWMFSPVDLIMDLALGGSSAARLIPYRLLARGAQFKSHQRLSRRLKGNIEAGESSEYVMENLDDVIKKGKKLDTPAMIRSAERTTERLHKRSQQRGGKLQLKANIEDGSLEANFEDRARSHLRGAARLAAKVDDRKPNFHKLKDDLEGILHARKELKKAEVDPSDLNFKALDLQEAEVRAALAREAEVMHALDQAARRRIRAARLYSTNLAAYDTGGNLTVAGAAMGAYHHMVELEGESWEDTHLDDMGRFLFAAMAPQLLLGRVSIGRFRNMGEMVGGPKVDPITGEAYHVLSPNMKYALPGTQWMDRVEPEFEQLARARTIHPERSKALGQLPLPKSGQWTRADAEAAFEGQLNSISDTGRAETIDSMMEQARQASSNASGDAQNLNIIREHVDRVRQKLGEVPAEHLGSKITDNEWAWLKEKLDIVSADHKADVYSMIPNEGLKQSLDARETYVQNNNWERVLKEVRRERGMKAKDLRAGEKLNVQEVIQKLHKQHGREPDLETELFPELVTEAQKIGTTRGNGAESAAEYALVKDQLMREYGQYPLSSGRGRAKMAEALMKLERISPSMDAPPATGVAPTRAGASAPTVHDVSQTTDEIAGELAQNENISRVEIGGLRIAKNQAVSTNIPEGVVGVITNPKTGKRTVVANADALRTARKNLKAKGAKAKASDRVITIMEVPVKPETLGAGTRPAVYMPKDSPALASTAKARSAQIMDPDTAPPLYHTTVEKNAEAAAPVAAKKPRSPGKPKRSKDPSVISVGEGKKKRWVIRAPDGRLFHPDFATEAAARSALDDVLGEIGSKPKAPPKAKRILKAQAQTKASPFISMDKSSDGAQNTNETLRNAIRVVRVAHAHPKLLPEILEEVIRMDKAAGRLPAGASAKTFLTRAFKTTQHFPNAEPIDVYKAYLIDREIARGSVNPGLRASTRDLLRMDPNDIKTWTTAEGDLSSSVGVLHNIGDSADANAVEVMGDVVASVEELPARAAYAAYADGKAVSTKLKGRRVVSGGDAQPAKLTALDHAGFSPEMQAQKWEPRKYGANPLRPEQNEILARMEQRYRALIDEVEYADTPAMKPTTREEGASQRFLLEKRAGRTAMDYAEESMNQAAARTTMPTHIGYVKMSGTPNNPKLSFGVTVVGKEPKSKRIRSFGFNTRAEATAAINKTRRQYRAGAWDEAAYVEGLEAKSRLDIIKKAVAKHNAERAAERAQSASMDGPILESPTTGANRPLGADMGQKGTLHAKQRARIPYQGLEALTPSQASRIRRRSTGWREIGIDMESGKWWIRRATALEQKQLGIFDDVVTPETLKYGTDPLMEAKWLVFDPKANPSDAAQHFGIAVRLRDAKRIVARADTQLAQAKQPQQPQPGQAPQPAAAQAPKPPQQPGQQPPAQPPQQGAQPPPQPGQPPPSQAIPLTREMETTVHRYEVETPEGTFTAQRQVSPPDDFRGDPIDATWRIENEAGELVGHARDKMAARELIAENIGEQKFHKSTDFHKQQGDLFSDDPADFRMELGDSGAPYKPGPPSKKPPVAGKDWEEIMDYPEKAPAQRYARQLLDYFDVKPIDADGVEPGIANSLNAIRAYALRDITGEKWADKTRRALSKFGEWTAPGYTGDIVPEAQRLGSHIFERDEYATQAMFAMREALGQQSRWLGFYQDRMNRMKKVFGKIAQDPDMAMSVVTRREQGLPFEDIPGVISARALEEHFKTFDQITRMKQKEIEAISPKTAAIWMETYVPRIWDMNATRREMLRRIRAGELDDVSRALFTGDGKGGMLFSIDEMFADVKRRAKAGLNPQTPRNSAKRRRLGRSQRQVEKKFLGKRRRSRGDLGPTGEPGQYDYIREMYAAGARPRTWNIVDMYQLKWEQMDEFLTRARIAKNLEDNGLLKWMSPSDIQRASIAHVKAGGKGSPYTNMKDLGEWSDIAEKRGKILVAPNSAARIVHNHIGPNMVGWNSRGGRAYRNVNARLNAIQLGFSLFHMGTMGIEAMVSNLELMARKGTRGAFAGPTAEMKAMGMTRGKLLREATAHAIKGLPVPLVMPGLLRASGPGNLRAAFERMDRVFARGLKKAMGTNVKGEARYSDETFLTTDFFEGGQKSDYGRPGMKKYKQVFGRSLGSHFSDEWLHSGFESRTPGAHWNPMIPKIIEYVTKVNGHGRMIPTEYQRTLQHTIGDVVAEMKRDPSAFPQVKAAGLKATRGFFQVVENFSHFLFNSVIPHVKMAAFVDLMRYDIIKLGPHASNDKLLRMAMKNWDSIDNRFGMMIYDNLFLKRAFRDTLFIVQRAPGWNWGTKREIAGGVIDAGKFATLKLSRAAQALKSGVKGKGFKGVTTNVGGVEEFTQRASYALTLGFSVPMMGIMYQYFMTGEGPEYREDLAPNGPSNLKENIRRAAFPINGQRRGNGSLDRFSLPTYLKDIFAYADDFFGTLSHKVAPILGFLKEIIDGHDYWGNLNYDPNDSSSLSQWADSAWGAVKHAVTPFSIQNVLDKQKQGVDWKYSAFEFLTGNTSAPAKFRVSPSEKMLDELMGGSLPEADRSPGQQDQRDAVQKFQRELIAEESTDESYKSMRAAGVLPNKIDRAIDRASEIVGNIKEGYKYVSPNYARKFNNATFGTGNDHIAKLYEVVEYMNPEEFDRVGVMNIQKKVQAVKRGLKTVENQAVWQEDFDELIEQKEIDLEIWSEYEEQTVDAQQDRAEELDLQPEPRNPREKKRGPVTYLSPTDFLEAFNAGD